MRTFAKLAGSGRNPSRINAGMSSKNNFAGVWTENPNFAFFRPKLARGCGSTALNIFEGVIPLPPLKRLTDSLSERKQPQRYKQPKRYAQRKCRHIAPLPPACPSGCPCGYGPAAPLIMRYLWGVGLLAMWPWPTERRIVIRVFSGYGIRLPPRLSCPPETGFGAL